MVAYSLSVPSTWRTSRGFWLGMLWLLIYAPALQAQAPGRPTIHEYADAAACQMGAREPHYLPFGILPGGNRIPITWQGERRCEGGARPGAVCLQDGDCPGLNGICKPEPRCAAGVKAGTVCSADADCPSSTCILPGEVVWVPATNPPNGTGEFKIWDAGTTSFKSIAPDFPEPGANGPFNNPVQSNPTGLNPTGKTLKCDHFSYVSPSCTPNQFVREIFQGSCAGGVRTGAMCHSDDDCPASTCDGQVRWHILFRRSAAAATAIANKPATGPDIAQPGDWGPTYIPYYPVVDATGLKLDTYATVWLDGLGVPDPNTGIRKTAARDFSNGFRAGPIPRPGGKRPTLRKEGQRATLWFDTPDTMSEPGGNCNSCHGTPFNGSDWLKQSRLSFQNDEDLPYWFAGNDKIGFPNMTFFSTARETVAGTSTNFRCGGCHQHWLMGASSTPGGEFARYMTMVHDAHADNPFRTLASLQPGLADAYRILASSLRTDKPQAVFLDKRAQLTHYMPPAHPQVKVSDWNTALRKSYNAVACCGSDMAGMMVQPPVTDAEPGFDCANITCTSQVSHAAVQPGFVTPWMEANGQMPVTPATANGTQFIAAPDPATNVSLTLVDCPAAIVPPNPGDRCFRLVWSDSSGSPFNAPQTFHSKALPNKKVSDPNWAGADIEATRYCGDGLPTELVVDPASSVFPRVRESQIAVLQGDPWRFAYETFGVLPKCEKMALRLCGGWCKQKIQLMGEPVPGAENRLSTDVGQLLTLANDTLGDVSQQLVVTRSGFRKNLTTGRYIQTVTLKNTSAQPLQAPLSLVLKNLSANATLFNQSGTTGGDPYVSVAAGGDSLQLQSGASVSVVLEFTNPSNQAITYMTQTLALSISAACR